MPVVIIYGVPQTYKLEELEKLIPDIQLVIEGVEGLNVSAHHVSIFFPLDRVEKGLGEKVVVFINIHEKPTRTTETLAEMSKRVGERIKKFYFQKSLVEVFANQTDSKIFWKSKD